MSQMILGSLYENLGMAIASLKNISTKANFLIRGPFWLLQQWLNAIFKSFFDRPKPDENDETIKNRRVEATCLASMMSNDSECPLQ